MKRIFLLCCIISQFCGPYNWAKEAEKLKPQKVKDDLEQLKRHLASGGKMHLPE